VKEEIRKHLLRGNLHAAVQLFKTASRSLSRLELKWLAEEIMLEYENRTRQLQASQTPNTTAESMKSLLDSID
jgi:hypothetical protein